MSYAIVCDSVADLLAEEIKQLDVTVVPLIVTIDGEEFEDQVDISTLEFYERIAVPGARPGTSQPTPMKFAQVFQSVFDRGFDQIICINAAGTLSGTIESARLAAQEFDKPIEIIDSCGATASQGLEALYAARLKSQGVSFEEAVRLVREKAASTKFMLACNSLKFLLAGGRLSAEEVDQATALNIKPIFTFAENGALKPCGKVRGMNGAIKQFKEAIQKATEATGKQAIRFCHTGNPEDVDRLKSLLEKSGIEYEDAGTAPAGTIVATHLGLGSLGIACMPA